MTQENNASDVPVRLRALRGEIERLGLDGFIVPRSDEHQGEYVAPSSERLAWTSGFTGSAGLAVVLRDTAAIFIDGRYTLQAEAEVPLGLFHHCLLNDVTPTSWIAKNLPTGAKLGYDSWLLTPGQVSRFQVACKNAGAELTALAPDAANPIDAVWTDRPAAPTSKVVIHDDAFAGQSFAEKLKQVADDLKAQKIDTAVLTQTDSISWLLNMRGNDVPFTPVVLSFAIIDVDGGVDLFMDGRKLSPEIGRHLGPTVRCREPDSFGDALDQLGTEHKTVRLDPETAAAWVGQRLKTSGAAVNAGDDPCQLPKARKTAAQLDGIRAAHRRDGASLTRFLAWLDAEAPHGGITEASAADKLESLRRDNDHFQGLSFPTISGAGAHGAIVHYRVSEATDSPLTAGNLYLVDSGAQYLDGTTDVTRTVAIGKPSDNMRRHFTLVLQGHIALATARFPEGTAGSQLDILARRALWADGLDYEHGTGHGVGHYLGVHEGPQRISKHPNRVALEPGMVVSNEPGYYETGAYGIRIENLVTVKTAEPDEKMLEFETLTLAPLDRTLIDLDLMTGDEIAWVDAYHARVAEEIGPLVDKATAAWLKDVTAPLS